jgi:hypothetical protein
MVGKKASEVSEVPEVREYPDIPARVVGAANEAAAQAVWVAVAEWLLAVGDWPLAKEEEVMEAK